MFDLQLWQKISKAARKNDVSTLKALLSQRPSPETLNHGDPDKDDMTPLHSASRKGHLEVTKLLVEAGANVELVDEDGSTPLHYLLAQSNTEVTLTSIREMFTLLTNAGATVNSATAKISPLVPSDVIRAIVPEDTHFWLAANNDAPMIAAELAGGLDPNMKTENGMTLLHWACAGDAPECVQLLLDAGADVESKNEVIEEDEDFDYSQLSDSDLSYSQNDFEDDSDDESGDNDDFEDNNEDEFESDAKPIFYCMHESSQCLECMINYGVDVNQSSKFDYKAMYPIHFALAANSPACVTALVGAGAWVTEEEMELDYNDCTPLESALQMNPIPVDALRALLAAAGERVLSEKIYGMPPLFCAVENFTVDGVRVLVEAGANVDATDKDGMTPLHLASYNGHLEVAKLLVEAGANVDATNKDGKTPRQQALDYGHHEVAELLSEASKTQPAALKKAEEELRRQNAEQQAEIARLQAAADERTALQRKNDELQAANSALTAQVARLQTETAQTKAELAAARPSSTSTVAELQLRLDRTQICLEIVKDERNEFIAKNARYQEANRQLNERVAELQETIERGYY